MHNSQPQHGVHINTSTRSSLKQLSRNSERAAARRFLDRHRSWILTWLVVLLGGFLRFFRLGEPRAVVFDETYYVKDAWTMLNTGEPRNWPDKLTIHGVETTIDQLFANGDTNNWLTTAEYVVHPPVGKWFIAIGLQLFGGASNPFAWRASVAIAGTIAILLLIRVTLRLFHNLSIALLAGMLMSIDGVGITLSRTGLLDNFIMVLALGAFMLILLHRDWANRKIVRQFALDAQRYGAQWVPARSFRPHRSSAKHTDPTTIAPNSNDGISDATSVAASIAEPAPRMLLRTRTPFVFFSWYRVGAAVLLGLATGVKWSGAYFFAAFCVVSVLWDALLKRRAGYYSWLLGGLRDGVLAACYMVPLYAAVYVAGWLSWFLHSDSYMHDWAATHPGEGITWLPEGLRSFVQYHAQMWHFHTTLESWHAYRANPLTWPLQIRPTSFYWEKLDGHPGLCSLAPHSQCVAAVTSLGNPLIWWLGSLCVIIGTIIAIMRRDWRIWAVLIGLIGGWLPWAQYLNRTTFTFYSIVILPWMILAICYVFNEIRRAADRGIWHTVLGVTIGLCALVSVFFYPIWTAMPVPYEFWLSHMWLQSWI